MPLAAPTVFFLVFWFSSRLFPFDAFAAQYYFTNNLFFFKLNYYCFMQNKRQQRIESRLLSSCTDTQLWCALEKKKASGNSIRNRYILIYNSFHFDLLFLSLSFFPNNWQEWSVFIFIILWCFVFILSFGLANIYLNRTCKRNQTKRERWSWRDTHPSSSSIHFECNDYIQEWLKKNLRKLKSISVFLYNYSSLLMKHVRMQLKEIFRWKAKKNV